MGWAITHILVGSWLDRVRFSGLNSLPPAGIYIYKNPFAQEREGYRRTTGDRFV